MGTLLLALTLAAYALAMTARQGSFGLLNVVLLSTAVITAGYALFQAANNTAVMANIPPGQRGVGSGLLNLSRNLGLITGASVMGAVFALGSAAPSPIAARPEAVAAACGSRSAWPPRSSWSRWPSRPRRRPGAMLRPRR